MPSSLLSRLVRLASRAVAVCSPLQTCAKPRFQSAQSFHILDSKINKLKTGIFDFLIMGIRSWETWERQHW